MNTQPLKVSSASKPIKAKPSLSLSNSIPASATGGFVIVVGNEKGGAGKSTTAMHIIVALLHMGFQVASLDLDVRQQTLSHYMKNREKTRQNNPNIPVPVHQVLSSSKHTDLNKAAQEEAQSLQQAVMAVAHADFIVIDTPGSDSCLSRLGHTYADVLVTPVNDSFVDLDLLVSVDSETYDLERPSCYADMVFEQRKRRLMRDGQGMDWVVMHNRQGHMDTRNRRSVATILQKVSAVQGFRIVPGFGERVIYRELFLKGLTLSDLTRINTGVALNMSHVSARSEVRALLHALNLPGMTESLSLI